MRCHTPGVDTGRPHPDQDLVVADHRHFDVPNRKVSADP
jgi:hypothetical protein